MSDHPNPDWVAWLARAETQEDIEYPPRLPMPQPVPGWKRVGDVAAKVVAGLIGGLLGLALMGVAIHAMRTL